MLDLRVVQVGQSKLLERRRLMKHWATKEEMGNGYQYNQKEHKEFSYNSLLKIEKHEETTMRTMYLIRDAGWTRKQLIDLKVHLDDAIMETEETDNE
jgi:hypothetical protein